MYAVARGKMNYGLRCYFPPFHTEHRCRLRWYKREVDIVDRKIVPWADWTAPTPASKIVIIFSRELIGFLRTNGDMSDTAEGKVIVLIKESFQCPSSNLLVFTQGSNLSAGLNCIWLSLKLFFFPIAKTYTDLAGSRQGLFMKYKGICASISCCLSGTLFTDVGPKCCLFE